MIEETKVPEQLKKILKRAIKNKVYGSLEIYLENGKITQITQRIINKIGHPKKIIPSPIKSISHKNSKSHPENVYEIPAEKATVS